MAQVFHVFGTAASDMLLKRHDLPKDIFLRYDIWKQGVLYS